MWAKLVHLVLDYILGKLFAFISQLVEKFKRDKKQEEAIQKVEENQTAKKPRDEEVIKDETDALNS